MDLNDVDSIYVHDCEIYVDILKQSDVMNKRRQSDSDWILEALSGEYLNAFTEMLGDHSMLSMPTMPLNTDGIDPSGSNVTIRNVNITNFDDAVAVKPSHTTSQIAKDGCSQDILVENCNIKFGVGMTIGSVPPRDTHACVRRVTFRNIDFEYPLKAIYVKTNPG